MVNAPDSTEVDHAMMTGPPVHRSSSSHKMRWERAVSRWCTVIMELIICRQGPTQLTVTSAYTAA